MAYITLVCALLIAVTGYVKGTDCPDGWLAYHHSCYYFARGNFSTYINAQAFCKAIAESTLIQVETPEENAFVKNYLSGLKSEDHWMGLSDTMVEGVYIWENSGEQVQHTDWRHGAPNNHHDQDCVMFDHAVGYTWDDVDCEKHIDPICEIQYAG